MESNHSVTRMRGPVNMVPNLGQNLLCERSILFDLFELLFLAFSKDFFRGTGRSANSVLSSLQLLSPHTSNV